MTVHNILHIYVQSLYFINNKLRNKYSRYSTNSPYLQHRIGMDLEIAKRNIERELVSLATTTGTCIPVLRKSTKTNINTLTQAINTITKNTNFEITYPHPSNYASHYAQLRYSALRTQTLAMPYIKHTALSKILHP